MINKRSQWNNKAKLKGVAIKEVEEFDRPTRLVLTLKPLPKIDPKDKGKGVLKEEPEPAKKIKKRDLDAAQLAMDKEVSRQLNEQLQAKLERERVAKEEATNAALISEYDEIQARIKADSIVAARLQEEEREKFTVEERAKFLHDTIANKKAASDDTSKKEKILKEPDNTKMEVEKEEVEERTRKRLGSPRMKRISKWKKADSDLEEEEHLKNFLKIFLDEEGLDRHGAEGIYYRIFRSDGSSRWVITFSEMVIRLDRLDLVELYNLVMQRSEIITPEDGTEIHMLAKRKYPLTKETLKKMMSLKLVAESASDSAYNLLRFIQKQIDESGSYDGSEKDL
ncbi:hypothetical protein Tco_0883230 [Tanacetum coccineum]